MIVKCRRNVIKAKKMDFGDSLLNIDALSINKIFQMSVKIVVKKLILKYSI